MMVFNLITVEQAEWEHRVVFGMDTDKALAQLGLEPVVAEQEIEPLEEEMRQL